MGRFVIAVDGMNPGINSDHQVTGRLESIFTSTGKIISENEVALVLMNMENTYTVMKIILDTVNNYDRVKYINGYSRDIISIFTRVEVSQPGGTDGNEYSSVSNGKDAGRPLPSSNASHLEPVDILEKSAIMNLMADGYLPLISAPGAPVVKNLQYYSSVKGTVESNMYSSLLATLIEADTLMVITNAPLDPLNTWHNNNSGVIKMDYMGLQEKYMSGYYKDTGLGSMIKAIISFISKGGSRSLIIPAGRMDRGIEISR
ncbi:hypothetical protein [Ferroplasma sp.]|uniref:hypothetical protein n=1 Tax=Ferroplasma sp. TaxID=2591003 RepID=UPI002620CE65|nr:hypothetical protein [Ferroplasma sp.]